MWDNKKITTVKSLLREGFSLKKYAKFYKNK